MGIPGKYGCLTHYVMKLVSAIIVIYTVNNTAVFATFSKSLNIFTLYHIVEWNQQQSVI